jgi:hypothetical protein
MDTQKDKQIDRRTTAFDVVNIDLLLTRLTTIGLPLDWMYLLESCLRDRAAFVEVSVYSSMLYDINIRTVQGSILGLVLFSLFVSPVFELQNIVAYGGDTYKVTSSRSKENLVTNIGVTLTAISLWFQSSGLKVNVNKWNDYKNKGNN